MRRLVRREFVVERPVEEAWRHLARVEAWPSWAQHIRRVEPRPRGELGPASTGVIRLRNGVRSAFAMTEFDPPRHWKWIGRFLWLAVQYDHRFEAVGAGRTRLIWTVDVEGFGVATIGRLFAAIYERNLDAAIPALVAEMNAGESRSE